MSKEKIVKSYFDEIIIDYNDDDLDEIPEYVRCMIDHDLGSSKLGIRITAGIGFVLEPQHAIMLGKWLTSTGQLLAEKEKES